MKSAALTKLDARTRGINAAFRRAAKVAATRARAAGTKLYYKRDGKLVTKSPCSPPTGRKAASSPPEATSPSA